MRYIGDFTEDATIKVKFETSGTFAGSPALAVYKDDNTTESTAGITLTVDFDSVANLHQIVIDLSTDAFYSTGSDYDIVVTSGTVDGDDATGSIVRSFSIENRSLNAGVNSLLVNSAILNNTVEADGIGGYRFKTSAFRNLIGADSDTLEKISDQLDEVFQSIGDIFFATNVAGDTGNTTTTIHLPGTNRNLPDGELKDYFIKIGLSSDSFRRYGRWITGWDQATQVATLDEALPFAPSEDDPYTILGFKRDEGLYPYIDDATTNVTDAINALAPSLIPSGDPTVERAAGNTDAIRFSWPTDGETITGEVSFAGAAYTAVAGAITQRADEAGVYWYQLAYNVADRAVGANRYKFSDGTLTRFVNLVVTPASSLDETGLHDSLDSYTNKDNWKADVSGLALEATLQSILEDTGTTIPASIDLLALETTVQDILEDTNELQTELADGGRIDMILDTIATNVIIATINTQT